MNTDYKIDVFIPVFNDIHFIERSITSCLDQVEVDVRVIVSDNCSTDGTFERVRSLAASDNRIKLHRNPRNIGLNGNLHRLHDLVTRPYYMFLCSDDYLIDRNAFRDALRLFAKHSKMVSVYSDIDFVDSSGNRILRNRFRRGETFDATETFRLSLISTRNKFGIPLLHRTEIASRFRFRDDITYANDLWHSYVVGKEGVCGHIPRSCIANTYSGNNLTVSLMKRAINEFQLLAKSEGIALDLLDQARQWLNHIRLLAMKTIFFWLILPVWERWGSAGDNRHG